MDTFWLLGKAVGIATGRGPKVDGHHHEKGLLLGHGVSIVLQMDGVAWKGEGQALSSGGNLHPAQFGIHCRQTTLLKQVNPSSHWRREARREM